MRLIDSETKKGYLEISLISLEGMSLYHLMDFLKITFGLIEVND